MITESRFSLLKYANLCFCSADIRRKVVPLDYSNYDADSRGGRRTNLCDGCESPCRTLHARQNCLAPLAKVGHEKFIGKLTGMAFRAPTTDVSVSLEMRAFPSIQMLSMCVHSNPESISVHDFHQTPHR